MIRKAVANGGKLVAPLTFALFQSRDVREVIEDGPKTVRHVDTMLVAQTGQYLLRSKRCENCLGIHPCQHGLTISQPGTVRSTLEHSHSVCVDEKHLSCV